MIHNGYSIQQRINEYRQALEWLHSHQHLPELLASIYAEVIQRDGTLWFGGASVVTNVHLFAGMNDTKVPRRVHPLYEESVKPRDVVVITAPHHIERVFSYRHWLDTKVCVIGVTGRKAVYEHSLLSKNCRTMIYVEADGARAVEVGAMQLQMIVAEILENWKEHHWRRQTQHISKIQDPTDTYGA